MNKIITLLLICCLLPASFAEAATRKKKESKTEKKQVSEYDKLFNSPTCKTEKGMITLHKVGGKVYFEMPLALMGKEMLLGSTVEEISDLGEAIIGQKPHDPMHIYFTKIDSAVQLRYVYKNSVTAPGDDNIQRAIDKGNIGAILKSFPVKCWNNDTSAVVFDITDFLVSDMYALDPFDPYGANTYYGWIVRITNFKDDRSFIGDIQAFDDNVSITSHLSFGVTLKALGMFEFQTDKPCSAVVKRSLILLPEEPMRPRILDPRIGIFYTGKMKFTNKDNRSDVVYYANHWRLEPSDMEAFKKGQLVEPKKPIVFYMDSNFPPMWKKYIRQGIEDWNLAFEKIGFKNAVRALDYPENNPEFDPGNLKYTCVLYAPIAAENAMGPSWVDPRSGEILNASVYIYHNLVSLLYKWRTIQTAAVDPAVRSMNLPEEIMGDAIRYVARHEVGHCFGLMHNMAASNAFPTDSLRSASFTQKHGTTPSIMDYARFNYVAQPGDKGVRLTPPTLGEYDYYVINWLYRPIPEAKSAEEEVPVLTQWISEKAADPIYRYGKQQIRSRYDPTSMEEDLGDDAIKSVGYGMENLKYVMKNFNGWVKPGEDKDYTYRESMYYALLNQYSTLVGHIYPIIGGIRLNEKYVGDPRPTYESISKADQKKAVQFLLELQDDTEWLEDKELLKELPIIGNPGKMFQDNTMQILIRNAFNLDLCALKSNDPYTADEYLQDIYDYIMKPTKQGKALKGAQFDAQRNFVNSLIAETGIQDSPAGGSNPFGISGTRNEISVDQWLDMQMFRKFGYISGKNKIVEKKETNNIDEIGAVGYQTRVSLKSPAQSHVYYNVLLKTRSQLEQAKNTGDANTKAHYAYLLSRIDKAMKIK